MFMKILPLSILLAISLNSFAQKENKFDSVYMKVMSIVKEWESKPLEISMIKQKNFSSGRKSNLSITSKVNQRDNRSQNRKIKIRYSRAGVRFEKIRILVGGYIIGKIKKVNGNYLKVEVRNLSDHRGNEFRKAIIVDDKYIILKNKNFYLSKYYWKQ